MYRFILLLIASLLGIFNTLVASAQDSVAQTKPNMIYLLLDDAGYADLSCYGQKRFTTPNIDQLSSEGMRFTQHYSRINGVCPHAM